MYELFQAIMTAPLPSPSKRANGVPLAVDDIVLRAMSRNPRDRFSSVRSFGAALLPFACERDRLAWNAELNGSPEEPVSHPTQRRDDLEGVGAPATMPPTARDTRASALQKRLVRRARAGLLASAGVVASTMAWTAWHGRNFSHVDSAAAAAVVGANQSPSVTGAPDVARATATASDRSPVPEPEVPTPAPMSTPPRSLRPMPHRPAVAASGSTSIAESIAPTPMGNNGAPILPP